MSKDTSNNPTRWMLGGDPPEPQNVEPAKPLVDDDGEPVEISNGDTHTGTDPLGRAIGPAESHLHVKRVRNDEGKIVKPYEVKIEDGKPTRKTIDTRPAESRAAKVAKATGTKPEAQDDPTPILPAEVARLHEDG